MYIDETQIGQIISTNAENCTIYKIEVGKNPSTDKWAIITHMYIDGSLFKSYLNISLVEE